MSTVNYDAPAAYKEKLQLINMLEALGSFFVISPLQPSS